MKSTESRAVIESTTYTWDDLEKVDQTPHI